MSVHGWNDLWLHPRIRSKHDTINLRLIIMMTSTSVRHIWTLARFVYVYERLGIRKALGFQRDPSTGIPPVLSC